MSAKFNMVFVRDMQTAQAIGTVVELGELMDGPGQLMDALDATYQQIKTDSLELGEAVLSTRTQRRLALNEYQKRDTDSVQTIVFVVSDDDIAYTPHGKMFPETWQQHVINQHELPAALYFSCTYIIAATGPEDITLLKARGLSPAKAHELTAQIKTVISTPHSGATPDGL